jgi:hypothetical protein
VDGSFADEERRQLLAIGAWLRVNGEAIYATRPWLTHGEGPNLVDKGRGFSAAKESAVQFGPRDVRFTQSKDGETLYAICLGWPDETITFQTVQVADGDTAGSVALLGHAGELECQCDATGRLVIHVPRLTPAQRPCEFAYAFKLSGFKLGLHPDARFSLPTAVTLPAVAAVLEGDIIKLETPTDEPNIGFWNAPTQRVHWLARIEKAGTYALRGEFAAVEPSTARLGVEGRACTFEIPATGSWTKRAFVPVGELAFDKPGVYHVILEPANAETWKPINVWKIQLAPAP